MTQSPWFPWVRLTQPLGTEPERDRGWVLPQTLWQDPRVLPLSSRREVPVVLVVGERGVGKSAVLGQEQEDLQTGGADVVPVDLARLTSGRARRKVRKALSWPGDSVRHVLLDAMDDASAAAEIDKFITETLEDLSEDARALLRLRISCRTSRRSPLLEECLRELWGREPLVVSVAGLTRQDALIAARAYDLDAEAFVDRLEREKLVIPLASFPVTLLPLLKAAANGQDLPGNAVDAYQLACRQLCTEDRARSSADTRDRSLEAGELIALARKAAAAVQFCARDGLAEHDGEPGTVTFAELAQGSEPVDGGGTVRCTESAYRTLTQAGILVATGDGRWSFAHRSFQEFLAADYLRVRSVEPAVRDELLMVGDGPTRQVASRQRDVAAWLALSDRALFEQMLRADPRNLLLGDLSLLSDQDRARAFDAMLDLVRAGVDPGFDWQTLSQLDSTLIVDRIRPLLQAGHPMAEVSFALSVANACTSKGLADALLGVAEDKDVPDGLRALALNAVVDASQEAQIARLRRLVADPDPDVAAHAIDLLWPDHLSAAELLANVPVPRPNYLGRARMFLRRLPDLLGQNDQLAAVRWARTVLGREKTDGGRESDALAEAATDVLAHAVTGLAGAVEVDSDVIDAVAEALLALIEGPYRYSAHTESPALHEALGASASTRRALARSALKRAKAEQISEFCSPSSVLLFQGSADAAYWAVQWPALSPKTRVLMQAPLVHAPTDMGEWAAAYEVAEQHDDLHRLIAHWFSCPCPPEKNWMREAYYTRREAAQTQAAERDALRYDEASLRAALETALSGPDDLRTAWRTVLHHLHRTTNGDPVNIPDRLDVTGAPHFPAAGSPLSHLLLQAAETVLSTAPEIDAEHIGPHGLSPWHEAPELYALATLARAGRPLPRLDAARWTNLAIALLCAQGGWEERDLRRDLVQRCAAAANDGFDRALRDALDRLGEYALAHAVDQLSLTLEPAHEQVLLDWARERRRPIPNWAQVLRALSKRGSEQALGMLRAAVAVPPSRLRGDLASIPVRRWLAAADVLTKIGDAASWTRILKTLDREPRLATPLLNVFVQASSLGAWPLEPHQISTADLAQLYIVMADHVPMPADFFNTPSGFVGRSQDLLHLHRALPVVIHSRGGTESLDTLQDLSRRYPQNEQLRGRAAELALHVADQSWRPPATVKQLVEITSGRTSRIVQSEVQLRDVVLESLKRLRDRLQGDNGWATALWNQKKAKTAESGGKPKEVTLWWPTWENDLSDFVTTFLRYDLADRNVVVNREIEVTRPGLNGSRTDIQIQAAIEDPSEPEPLIVIIETKGCWNGDLDRGLASQLVDKYLLRPGRRAGIYLVGYVDDDAWRDEIDGRHDRNHKHHTLDDILVQQQEIAEREQREKHVSVVPFVLDCRLPAARLRHNG